MSDPVSKTTKSGVFVEQKYGARVATIREGENGVEMKDNRDGTCDLTVFWDDPNLNHGQDLTAYRLNRDALVALRRAIDGMLVQIAGSAETHE